MAALTIMDDDGRRERPGPPFRPDISWTTEAYDGLKQKISQHESVHPDIQYKLVIFGPVQSGKSSLINTFLSAMRGKYAMLAHSAPAMLSVTKTLRQYPVRRGARTPPVLLCDTMGYEIGPEDEQYLGPNMKDVELILDGQIGDDYTFDPLGISFDEMKSRHDVRRAEQVNLVVIVWDAMYVEDPIVIKQLKRVMQAAHDRRISTCVLVTKIDKCSETVDRDLSKVFHNDQVLEVLEKVSQNLEIEMASIFPMQNYTPRHGLSMPINCLALHTLAQLLDLADLTMERQYGLPCDHVTSLLERPWREVKLVRRDEAVQKLRACIGDALEGKDVKHINVAVTGLCGAGKSELINAFLSAICGKPLHRAATGGNQLLPITKRFTAYETPLQLQLFDTMGLSGTEKQGLLEEDLRAVIQGQIPRETNFNVLEPCAAARNPPSSASSVADRMHAVVLVVDGATFASLEPKELTLLQRTYHNITDLGVPCVVLVSHTETLCPHVQKNAANMYFSVSVRKSVRDIRESRLCVPLYDILPVVTVPDYMLEEGGSEGARHGQLLHSLNHICDRAMDYIALQPLQFPENARGERPPSPKYSIRNIVLTVSAAAVGSAAVLMFYAFQSL